jgi:outer membrane protein OmpA-like peptidoglycan-associated protein
MNKKRTKTAELPSKKVADGVNTTYMLVKQGGVVGSKADSYQEVIPSTAEGQIQFAYNSAELRNSELKGQSMKDFLAALDEITGNNRKTVTGTEIIAYASPEGSVELNDALSAKRGDSGNKAWNKLTKKYDIAAPDVQSKG